MQREQNDVKTIFFDIREYFEISVFEISRSDCMYLYYPKVLKYWDTQHHYFSFLSQMKNDGF